MKIVTSGEMREIDRISIEEYLIPSMLLMGMAGRETAREIMSLYPDLPETAIICGTGNNGGDGFAAAYYLFNHGVKVKVFIAGDPAKISGDPLTYKNICEKMNIPVAAVTDPGIFEPRCGLIVDAIFGTGFRGGINSYYERLFLKINSHPVMKVSIDIPSGLPSEGEISSPCCINADVTVTIGLPKISLSTYPGKNYCGIVKTADIGFPRVLTDADEIRVSESLIHETKEILSAISDTAETHKYNRGHLMIAGGFEGMEGAALIAARAALETGIGLLTIITSGNTRRSIAGIIPEAMTAGITDDLFESPDRLTGYLIDIIHNKKISAAVIGPGLGRDYRAGIFFNSMISAVNQTGIKALIDADALYLMADDENTRPESGREKLILTPHIMEAARLLAVDKTVISSDRITSAVKISEKYSCTTLLKGPATIITDGENTKVNQTGNPNLAAAGSGDALSGIAGALLCRISAQKSASASACIHGLAGDLLLKEGFPSITAGDIVNRIHQALNTVYGS